MDVVYTYVNFKDNNWKNNYFKYKGKPSVRVCSLNELELSVKYTLNNCSFVRNIFILTDNQIPSWYCKNIYKKIKIIYHKDIFDDDCIYPTYNSNTIECYLHKIPDLSETFLYLNDDFFINLKKEDLFDKETNLPNALVLNNINWNYSWEEAKKKHINNPAVYALYSTIKMAEKFFNKKFDISYTHLVYVLNKSACKLTEKIFMKQYKKKVKMRFRETLSNDDFVFPLLANIVGSEYNLSKLTYLKETNLSNLFLNCSLSNIEKLNTILKDEVNLFCINDIKTYDKKLIEKYYKFSNNIRKQFSNNKTVSVTISDLLIINLDESKKRLDFFIENLYNNNFYIKRISGFNGNLLSNDEFNKIKQDKSKFQGINLTKKGEYGCWISHLKCYKYIVDNVIEWCIVMEDDAILKPDLSKKLKNISIPDDADIIYIHSRGSKAKKKKSDIKGFDMYIDGWGTDGYIISYRCAKKILDSNYSKIYYLPMDHLLNRLGNKFENSFTSENRSKIKNVKIPTSLNLNLYVAEKPLLDYTIFQSTIQ